MHGVQGSSYKRVMEAISSPNALTTLGSKEVGTGSPPNNSLSPVAPERGYLEETHILPFPAGKGGPSTCRAQIIIILTWLLNDATTAKEDI